MQATRIQERSRRAKGEEEKQKEGEIGKSEEAKGVRAGKGRKRIDAARISIICGCSGCKALRAPFVGARGENEHPEISTIH